MSRSRRKTAISGIANSVSEKKFKRHTNHVFRQTQKGLLRRLAEDEALEARLPRKPREAVETYCGDKDGKSWFGGLKKKAPKYFEKLMRK